MKKLFLLLFVALGVYVVTAPIWPNVTFYIFPVSDIDVGDALYSNNVLIIPSISLSESIYIGGDEDMLENGVWKLPWSDSTNPVLTAHRFTYIPPYTQPFYHLDKVEIGDEIIYVYEGIKYEYVVDDIMIVEPDKLEVEEGGGLDKITLYTCTPLWTVDKRLVIIGKLVRQEQLSGIL